MSKKKMLIKKCIVHFIVFSLIVSKYYVNCKNDKVMATSNVNFLLQIPPPDNDAIGISSVDDLILKISNNPSGHFKLTNDIDISGFFEGGYWNPLCSEEGFSGILDGQGHKIYTIDNAEQIVNEDVEKMGLFEHLSGAVVKNLRVDVDYICGQWTGGIATTAKNSTIQNCIVFGNEISAKFSNSTTIVGGFVAYAMDEIKIYDSVLACNISTYSNNNCTAGGFIGEFYGGNIEMKNLKLLNNITSNTNGTEDFNDVIVGGLVGELSDSISVVIDNVVIDGNQKVNALFNGKYLTSVYSGGLVGKDTHYYGSGKFYYDNKIDISNIQINGDIDVDSQHSSCIGGLIGLTQGRNEEKSYTLECKKCIISNNIISNSLNGGTEIGGCIGFGESTTDFSDITVKNTKIAGSANGYYGYIGGLVGYQISSVNISTSKILPKISFELSCDTNYIGGVLGNSSSFSSSGNNILISDKTYYNCKPAFGDYPDYTDDNLIYIEGEEIPKAIAVFTTNKSMKVKTGKSMWLGFGLLDKNSGLLDDKWRNMSVVVSNSTVIGLSDYKEMEYGYSLEVIGKKQGTTNITITDTETGINTIITVSVQDDYVDTYSYAIDNIAHFYPNNNFEKDIETNIYNLNGLYVNNYKCTKSTDSYNVSFDVYNSKYYSGAVDIYDENGMWTGYEEIDKYSDISSFWNTIEQTWYLVSDTVTGKMLTYEQASFSKHKHIDIEVPEGGYFTISNNVSESPGTFFINAFEILFNGVSTAYGLLNSGNIEDSALTKLKKEAKKTFATRLIEARNEGLKDNVKRTSQKIMLDSMKSKIKEINKENIKTGLKDKLTSTNMMCSSIANLAEDMLAPQSFNIEWKSILENATGIGESFFTKFAGPAGIALEGCFALNDSASTILMATQMAESAENPYVTIFSSIDTGYINPYGITVNSNGNIDAEAVLQVFRVSNNDVVEILLDSDNPFENYELYNICFVKNDKLVQPNGKVTVQIPVPKGMKGSTCKVYRQEPGGAWTIIDAKVQGNYLVFETEHFSLYTIIGENDKLVLSSLPKKINYENGEVLDTRGLVLDLNGELITEGYICEPTVLSGNGKQFIKVIYGHSVAEFEVNVDKTESPSVSPSPAPVVTPTPVSTSPTQKPSGGSSGGGTTDSGGGGYISGDITPVPSPSPSPAATPVATIVPEQTPDLTPVPSTMPEPTKEPEVTPAPSASFVTGENNNTSSSAKLKKGLKIKDKKTKAVYKVTSTGKNKTAEYVKSTKKSTADIFIPASVKLKGKTFKVVSVGNGAFKNNKKLKAVKIGKNIKVINKEVFSGCKKLEKVKMGKNVTSIGTKAFNNCSSLRIITIPSKVKKIEEKAFYQCKNLQYILVKTKKLKPGNIGNNAFSRGYSNPRVKTDKSVWKQYQTDFTAKGLSGKALFIINPVKLVV